MTTPAEQASERAIARQIAERIFPPVSVTWGSSDDGASDALRRMEEQRSGAVEHAASVILPVLTAEREARERAEDLSDIQAENREMERVLSEARLAECERERDAYHAQFKGIGITPYLERMRELSKRAEKAEAEVRELREEITRLRAALESKGEASGGLSAQRRK
jgi:chromosome segregation ATPase